MSITFLILPRICARYPMILGIVGFKHGAEDKQYIKHTSECFEAIISMSCQLPYRRFPQQVDASYTREYSTLHTWSSMTLVSHIFRAVNFGHYVSQVVQLRTARSPRGEPFSRLTFRRNICCFVISHYNQETKGTRLRQRYTRLVQK